MAEQSRNSAKEPLWGNYPCFNLSLPADVSRRGQDKGPQAVVKIIKIEEYKAMDVTVQSIKY